MAKTIKPFHELTLSDNYAFGKVMRNGDVCKTLLEMLLHIKIEKLTFPEVERQYKVGVFSHGIRVDVHASDPERDYDIELQALPEPDLAVRMRYYQSVMDVDFLQAGNPYKMLKTNIIIFLCMYDPFGKGMPLYTFENICREDAEIQLGDRTSKLVYNVCAWNKIHDAEMRMFCKYLLSREPGNEYTKRLAELLEVFKMTAREMKEYMDLQMLKDEWREDGYVDGAYQKSIDIAKRMLSRNARVEDIAFDTALPIETVCALAKETVARNA
ncbi:MAG: Rpn family recombination-promoting nuclease/putative transposase [Treponema sp.]|nr:Rpn family recombination-promoting nuclease/putative transposase [Treponema sp.]